MFYCSKCPNFYRKVIKQSKFYRVLGGRGIRIRRSKNLRIRVRIRNKNLGQYGPDPGPESGSGQEGPGSRFLFYSFVCLNFVAFTHLTKKVRAEAKVTAIILKDTCNHKIDCASFFVAILYTTNNLSFSSYLKKSKGMAFLFLYFWPLFFYFATVAFKGN